MRWLCLAVLLAAPPGTAAAVDAEEAVASERLASRAREAVDAILGPGHVKVLVDVKGERSHIHTETEMTSPLDPLLFTRGAPGGDSLSRILDLPGYTKTGPVVPELFMGDKNKEKAPEKPVDPQFVQHDREQSERDAGFEVKQIQAQVVLDTALPESAVREVSQLLPGLLMIDGSRGDTLAISRASFRPAWMNAFADAPSLRRAAYAAAACLMALLISLIGGFSFVRAARVFATELGRRRDALEQEGGGAEPLPELSAGAPGGFLDAETAGEPGEPGALGGPGDAPALGVRFDFLAQRDPQAVSRALAGESVDDAAMVFAYLAQALPEVASRAFAALTPDRQAEVSASLLKLRVADPDRLTDIEERLKRAVEHGVQGSERLGRILSRVPVDTRSDLLGRLTLRDHEGAADVERHLFTIEDLETLSPVELRRLIASVPYEAWGFALRGVPPGVIDRVLAELPDGPRELVRDILSGPQPRDKVLDARSKVLDARGALAAKGEIKLGDREAGSELL
jgi:hypothetical protein